MVWELFQFGSAAYTRSILRKRITKKRMLYLG
jgi:hypothetical protein